MLHYYDKQSIWWWMEPLETKVWLLFFGTAVAMGVVILLVELPWDTIIQQPQATLAKASNLQWASAALLVGGGPQMAPRSPGGRVMLLAFGFLVLTIMNLYIAAATATLSAAIMRREQVNDISDLAMMRVGIFEDDLRELQSFALSVGTPCTLYDQSELHFHKATEGSFVRQQEHNSCTSLHASAAGHTLCAQHAFSASGCCCGM